MKRSERDRAQALRKSQWWLTKLNQGICYYCKMKFSKKDLTMDHIVPISRGGQSTKSNCVVACKPCNNKKKSSIPVEWVFDS